MHDSTDIAARLVRATEGHRLLEHPFYRAWADGSLTVEDLSFYAKQYWRQVEGFPAVLETLAERLPAGSAKQVLTDNLVDERDGDHPGLWLDFAKGLGVGPDAVRSSAPEPETRGCVATFAAAATEAAPAYALGMLYGYESQTPEVAATKVLGLRDHYGIDGEAVEYFAVHGELDVEHAEQLATAIADIATDEDLELAAAGAGAGAAAIWGLLDGVARARGIG